MTWYERRRGEHLLSTDPERVDVGAVVGYLSRSYWAEAVPREVVERSVQGSLCFGVYHEEPGAAGRPPQVGFARVITDRATFAWLCDVYVLEPHRGGGLGKWLIESLLEHPDLQGLRRMMLATRDAHGLYERFGFSAPTHPEMYLEIVRPGMYLAQKG